MCSGFLRPEKNPSTSAGFEPANLGSQGEHVTPKTPRETEDNIRMHYKEIGINTRNLIDWAQDRDNWRDLVNAASSLRVP